MSRVHRHQSLPAGRLEPASPLSDVGLQGQGAAMVELRELTNQISDAYRARDERLLALAQSHSLSRHDMALATNLNKSRIDQIIREMAERHAAHQAVAAVQRRERHLAPR